MKMRTPAWRIIPVNRVTGVMAPSVYVTAEKYEDAKSQVAKTNTLVKRFPDIWGVI